MATFTTQDHGKNKEGIVMYSLRKNNSLLGEDMSYHQMVRLANLSSPKPKDVVIRLSQKGQEYGRSDFAMWNETHLKHRKDYGI